MARPIKVEVSHRTVIFTVFFILGVWFLFVIREIILQFFVATLIMAILNPLVTRLSKLKIPRAISVTLVYVLVLGFLGFVVASIAQPLVEQTTNFASQLPDYLEDVKLSPFLGEELIKEGTSQLGKLPAQVIKVGLGLFTNAVSVFTVFIFAFYLLLSRDRLDDQLAMLFGKDKSKKFDKVINQLEAKMGGWARAQLILMVLMGLFFYVGLLVLGIPFALPLALLVAILEIVPSIGPILGVIPSILVGFGISPLMGIAVASLSFLLHQLESYVLVPKVMQKSVGISPLVTLLSLIVGFKLVGVVGAILSIPIVISLQILGKEFVFNK